ncbi:MAG: Peptidoglycan-N-acetylglucosamine deacetylase [Bacteroidetes bacterium ADurb.Bin408]|nr:MAG: Peptidoglycan-N-acetylglucosamine deacetylase [Bacteroidetes bacterium ADurb.Bin408]
MYPGYFIWDMPDGNKDLYLTFDDGPVTGITDKVLHILDDFNIKATFFCVGENVEREPELYKTLIDKGHTTGNHTYNHLNGWKTDAKAYCDNVEKCRSVVNSEIFRPPYGRITYKQADALKNKYKIVMWTMLTYDFNESLSPAKCLENAIKHTRNGAIVVFHDNAKAESKIDYTLPKYIEHCLSKGFSFKKLG